MTNLYSSRSTSPSSSHQTLKIRRLPSVHFVSLVLQVVDTPLLTQQPLNTMRLFLLLIIFGLNALAKCGLPRGLQPHFDGESPSQEERTRHPNDVTPTAAGSPDGLRSGGRNHPAVSDDDGTGHLTGASTDVSLWEAMKLELQNVKANVDETRAAVSELAKKVERILQELETTNSKNHGKTTKEEEKEDKEGREEEDYKEVGEGSRVITLNDSMSCPTEFVDLNKQCLLFMSGWAGSYVSSERECTKRGGRLIASSNPRYLAFLAKSLYPNTDEYWIGLRYNSSTRDWRWSNGNVEPDARALLGLEDEMASVSGEAECALLKVRSIRLRAQPCAFYYSFICEADRME